MNMTPSEAKAFITELKPMVKGMDKCDIVLCVPYVDIATAVEAAKGSNIHIGAENVHFAKSGAYTGEVSAESIPTSIPRGTAAKKACLPTVGISLKLSSEKPSAGRRIFPSRTLRRIAEPSDSSKNSSRKPSSSKAMPIYR